jgi:hypothetical protein
MSGQLSRVGGFYTDKDKAIKRLDLEKRICRSKATFGIRITEVTEVSGNIEWM